LDTPVWILIIEDEVFQGKTLRLILERNGYQVSIAATVEEACAYLDKQRYDLLLLDLHLRNDNGLDLLEKIECGVDMHILVVTGQVTEDKRLEALQKGVEDFIIKPISPPELLERIAQIFPGRASPAPKISR
jgi:DNA-binding response OmpR family regulator